MKNIFFVIILLNFASCNKFGPIRENIKLFLLGKSYYEKIKLNDKNQDTKANIQEVSLHTNEINSIAKIDELLRAYSYTQGPDIESIILDQIAKSSSDIDKNRNEFLSNIEVLIEKNILSQDVNSIKFILRIYSMLLGDTKKEVGKIISSAFELNLEHFVNTYLDFLPLEKCELVKYVNDKVIIEYGESYVLTFLRERRLSLTESKIARIQICIDTLDSHLSSFRK